mgnify:CR=1 FL=1
MLRNGEGVQEDGLKVNDRPETAGLAPNTPHTCNLKLLVKGVDNGLL